MGAMNVMMKGLRKKFPNAAMVFTTVWNFPDTNSESTLTYLDYAKATEEVCEKWGVYCFKAYDPAVSGVDMRSEEFRAKYCMFPNDISHLNLSGMKLVMPAFEKYLDACMTTSVSDKKNHEKSQENSGFEALRQTPEIRRNPVQRIPRPMRITEAPNRRLPPESPPTANPRTRRGAAPKSVSARSLPCWSSRLSLRFSAALPAEKRRQPVEPDSAFPALCRGSAVECRIWRKKQ